MVTLTVPQSYRRCNVRVDRLNRPSPDNSVTFAKLIILLLTTRSSVKTFDCIRASWQWYAYACVSPVDVDIERCRVLRACRFAWMSNCEFSRGEQYRCITRARDILSFAKIVSLSLKYQSNHFLTQSSLFVSNRYHNRIDLTIALHRFANKITENLNKLSQLYMITMS